MPGDDFVVRMPASRGRAAFPSNRRTCSFRRSSTCRLPGRSSSRLRGDRHIPFLFSVMLISGPSRSARHTADAQKLLPLSQTGSLQPDLGKLGRKAERIREDGRGIRSASHRTTTQHTTLTSNSTHDDTSAARGARPAKSTIRRSKIHVSERRGGLGRGPLGSGVRLRELEGPAGHPSSFFVLINPHQLVKKILELNRNDIRESIASSGERSAPPEPVLTPCRSITPSSNSQFL